MPRFPALLGGVLTAPLVGPGAQAQAATLKLDFESPITAPFTLEDTSPFVGPGNCLAGDCLRVNAVNTDTIRIADGSTFSVTDFWFKLLGRTNDMIVETSKGSFALNEGEFLPEIGTVAEHNNGYRFTALSDIFRDITFLSFSMSSKTGNARVDDIGLVYDDVAPAPLPAGGLLLVGALGGLFALRRRKTA